MDTTLTVFKYRGRFPGISTSEENYNRLANLPLKGCPFDGYTALDLLRDLFAMYDWKIMPGYSYPLDQFLTLCNDAHAETYRAILTGRA